MCLLLEPKSVNFKFIGTDVVSSKNGIWYNREPE